MEKPKLRSKLRSKSEINQQTQPEPHPKNYDKIWQENPDGFGIPRESLVLECLKNLPKNAKIAEIASGNGRYALVLAERLQNLENQTESQVIAVEISPFGVDLIRQKAQDQSLDLEVICADFLEMDLEMDLRNLQDFDVVFCSGLLEELESEKEQIEAVAKIDLLR